MRKWRRKVAHARLERKGYSRVNKDGGTGSFFSKHWREIA